MQSCLAIRRAVPQTRQGTPALLEFITYPDGDNDLPAATPDFAQAHYNLGFALSRAGNSSEAIASFREALRCSPGDGNSHTALAEELFKTGETAPATFHVQRALELNPNDPKARALKERLAGGK